MNFLDTVARKAVAKLAASEMDRFGLHSDTQGAGTGDTPADADLSLEAAQRRTPNGGATGRFSGPTRVQSGPTRAPQVGPLLPPNSGPPPAPPQPMPPQQPPAAAPAPPMPSPLSAPLPPKMAASALDRIAAKAAAAMMPAAPPVTTGNQPQPQALAAQVGKAPAPPAPRAPTAAPVTVAPVAAPPKTAGVPALLKRAYFPPPHAMFGGNAGFPGAQMPYGFPQGAYNNASHLNPNMLSRGFAPGGGPGMAMAPHLAYTGAGGMSPFARGGFQQVPGMGGFGMMTPPGQTQEGLQHGYEQRRQQIIGLAGQLNPMTGRPYTQADIARQLGSLTADTNRALATMRSVHDTFGGGGGGGYGAFGHSPLAGGYGGGYGGMGRGPAGYGPMGFGSGYHVPGMPFVNPLANPLLSQGAEPSAQRAERYRQMLQELRGRSENTLARVESGEGAPVSREQLDAALRQLREAALATSDPSRTELTVDDPITGAAQRVNFGNRVLGMSGSGLWDTGAYQTYRQRQQEYEALAARYRQWAARQQRGATQYGTGSGEELRIQAQLQAAEREAEQDRQTQRTIQQQWAQRAFGLPPTPTAGGPGATTPPTTPGAGSFTPPSFAPPTTPPPPAPVLAAGGDAAPKPAAQQPAAPPSPGASPLAQAPTTAPATPAQQIGQKMASFIVPLSVDQLAKAAGRALLRGELDKRASLGRLALLTGGGALAGGVASAAAAPSDYAPEAFARGARVGAVSGAGMGLGSIAGGAAGRGYAHTRNWRHGDATVAATRGAPVRARAAAIRASRPWNPADYGAMGGVTGGLIGAGAGIAQHVGEGASPWEAGEVPVLDRLDAAVRRRVPAPQFGAPRLR